MTETPALKIDGLRKHFDGRNVLDIDSLTVEAGAFLCLLGPSGCGKTTLLRIIAGLDNADEGRLTLGGRAVFDSETRLFVQPRDRAIGMVFQSYALWPHMTVQQNIEWPLAVAGWSRADIARRRSECLDLVNIGELVDRYPSQLSGGQQQRVAIARAIAAKPNFLLFDEPLSALDAQLRGHVRTELVALHRETGGTYIYVTHDQVEALTMASHVAVMQSGRVEQFGEVAAIVENPQTVFVAGFVGMPAANLLPVGASHGYFSFERKLIARCPPHLRDGSYTLRYATEQIRLGVETDGPQLSGRVVERLPYAGSVVLVVDVHGTRLATVQSGGALPRIGDTATLSLPREPASIFSSSGLRV
jgi:iron(III) transport system ATP-binding protein